jgi:hypothetical protein
MRVSEGWRICFCARKVNIKDYCTKKIAELQVKIKKEICKQNNSNRGIGFLMFTN